MNTGAASRTGALLVLGWRRGRELLREDVKLGNSGCSLCEVFCNPVSPAHPALPGHSRSPQAVAVTHGPQLDLPRYTRCRRVVGHRDTLVGQGHP